mmetsp:Transcript_23193/g.46422  ORF Transcript_23193/g.46422 Transcript_23193/m.46422 type:complete len:201 (+) Transcript_23193:2870-3472(+)
MQCTDKQRPWRVQLREVETLRRATSIAGCTAIDVFCRGLFIKRISIGRKDLQVDNEIFLGGVQGEGGRADVLCERHESSIEPAGWPADLNMLPNLERAWVRDDPPRKGVASCDGAATLDCEIALWRAHRPITACEQRTVGERCSDVVHCFAIDERCQRTPRCTMTRKACKVRIDLRTLCLSFAPQSMAAHHCGPRSIVLE